MFHSDGYFGHCHFLLWICKAGLSIWCYLGWMITNIGKINQAISVLCTLKHHSIVNFKDDWLLLPHWCWAYSIVWNEYEDLYISLGIRATSATLLGLWESRGGYCVLFSWNWYSNSSSPLSLVSICPLPANLPPGISGMDLAQKHAGRPLVYLWFDQQSASLEIYNTTRWHSFKLWGCCKEYHSKLKDTCPDQPIKSL